ncbi:hypothetical protein H0G86_009256 [Trichoderma simmonsii]|uniref:Uncharacterized protein n=1 Tax=Trichoderma simmonsii TaxID=1491479 RepID=A0A8G0LK04_9HYPO|nr:hypothetical protein H0G86_009256 [Trichoderma simmonsii]
MASNNTSAQHDSRESSEAPSLSQTEELSVYQSSLQGESEGSIFEAESTPSTPEQINLWAPLDNFKASFINLMGHRLLQLLEKGALNIGHDAIIWIDENGLPATEGLPPLSQKDLETPTSLLFAGVNVDATGFENRIPTGRTLWRQPASNNEYRPENETTASSLFYVVFVELKSMPGITHFVWKNLLREFEKSAASGRPASERIVVSLVEEAIIREKKDFGNLELLEEAFTDLDVLLELHLSIPFQSIQSLLGVDLVDPDLGFIPDTLNHELNSEISKVIRLAASLQILKGLPVAPGISGDLDRGAEVLDKVAIVLREGRMGPLISDRITAWQYSRDMEHKQLFRGRKRPLE